MENLNQASIEERQREIVEEFLEMDDWQERYQAIADLGRSLEALAEEFHVPELKVSGCVSQVWLKADYRDGRVFFRADSDSIFVKGLIALLVRAYSGFRPEEILASDAKFLSEIGITDNLSPNRANGLGSMVNKIREYAKHFSG